MYAGHEELVFSLLETNLKEVGSGKELRDMLTDFHDSFAADDPDWKEKVLKLAKKNPNRKIIIRILDELCAEDAAGAKEAAEAEKALSEDTPGTDPGPAD